MPAGPATRGTAEPKGAAGKFGRDGQQHLTVARDFCPPPGCRTRLTARTPGVVESIVAATDRFR